MLRSLVAALGRLNTDPSLPMLLARSLSTCSSAAAVPRRIAVDEAWRQGQRSLRPFSKQAAAQEEAIREAVEDTLRPKVLRFFAFIMICSAGLNVMPAVAAQAVGNCLALLDAQQPFMVKAGCSRLRLLMHLEAGRQKAVEEGAARKLLGLVQRPDADPGVVDYALSTLEVLTATEAGLQSLADAGGAAALDSYLAGAEQTPSTEDAMWRAQQLQAALSAM